MTGVEIDMVVADSLKALELYEKNLISSVWRYQISRRVKMKSFLPYTEYALHVGRKPEIRAARAKP